ncbi:MAG: DUF4838 domain-containing protein [Acidobacteria bacterium]|nr:DUF4838 domain-containing protein [Acidobacteriota bacterium]
MKPLSFLLLVSANLGAFDDSEARRELAHYLTKATGSPQGNPARRFLVGQSEAPAAVKAALAQLPEDGYVIDIAANGTVTLAGNGGDGTAFAVYDFLERFLGVRWLWPGESGEVVAPVDNLRLKPGRIVEKPAFVWRSLGPAGALWGPLDKWTKERELGVSAEHQRTQKLWERRNRLGGLRVQGGHAFGEILPPARYGASHPEYFALVNGKRDFEHFDGKHGAQPCTTNPDVIRLTVDYCRRFLQANPSHHAVSISLNDGRGFCECDRCRRQDAGAQRHEAADPETGGAATLPVITDRIIAFASQVAAGVAQTHPDRKVLLFAYGMYKDPPRRERVHPNLIIQYTMHASGHRDPEYARKEFDELGRWSKAARNLAVYEYFVQGAMPDLPRLFPNTLASSVRRLHSLGYRYYETQAGDGYALNGLNYYLLARLLWNPQSDPEALQRDYFERGFGRAAPAVSRYLHQLAERYAGSANGDVKMSDGGIAEHRALDRLYPPEFRESLRRDLAEAASLEDSVRVKFLAKGFRYFDLTMTAVERSLGLLEAGWTLSRRVTPPAKPDGKAFDAALSAWDQRNQHVERNRNGFEVAYFWVRYNDANRSFVPLARMRDFDKRTRIRSALFAANSATRSRPRSHGSFEPEPGIVAERVSYTTAYGLRVPAILYLPRKRAGKIPALIVVNGHGGDKYSWYAFYSGILYARAGAAVLTYDPIGEGERNAGHESGTRAHDRMQPPPELGARLGGLMMTDVMQAVSYLENRAEVDPRRIGAMGYSMGSFVLSLAGAVEPRLRATVLVGGGNLDGPGEYWDTSKQMCQGLPYRALSFLGDRAAEVYALRAKAGPTLIFNGTGDTILQGSKRDFYAHFDDLRRRAGLLAPGTRVFENQYEERVGHRPFFVTKGAAEWLERQLDFPEWTVAQIQAMPVTHILSWARERAVDTDKLYATEHRAGGTQALGQNVPGLTREQLSAWPRSEWETIKGEMIYESWLERARRVLSGEGSARP